MKENSILIKLINNIENIGNKLPHPVSIFSILSILVIIISEILFRLKVSVEYIGFKDGIETIITTNANSLISSEGIRQIFQKILPNFIGFAPLGVVLLAMLGVGIAESSGLISSILKLIVLKTPKPLITSVVIFCGIISNIASDVGYVILIPLGAIIFHIMGRHPLAGLAATFAGVSGGFSANLLIGTIDILISGFTNSATSIVNPNYIVTSTANYYFMFVSTILLTIVGTIVTEKIIEPSLGKYEGNNNDLENISSRLEITTIEKKALISSATSFIFIVTIIALMVIPKNGILRGENGSILKSPFMNSLVAIISLIFFVPSVVYAFKTKKFKNDKDVVSAMTKSMSNMGYYLVLAFFASQFVYYFSYTNIATIISVYGANFLKSTGFTGIPLIIAFVLLSAFINLFIGSASAKWAIMAPIFVPLFLQLGYSPEFTQLAYRIGDSTTNIITPLMPYFSMVVIFADKYKNKSDVNSGSGLGTIASMMLPYSISFLVSWIILLVVWMILNLPIGIGGQIYYHP